MLAQIRLRPLYFITAFALLLLMLAGCLCFSRQQSFQFLNIHHDWLLDKFFIGFTGFGDGLTSIATVILLAGFNKRKEAGALLVAYLSSGLVVQFIKHTFNRPRPLQYFEDSTLHFHFIDNLELYRQGSFPSGHSASAFAMATVLALCFKDNRLGVLALLLAVLEAYSRVYLGQHFLEDVTAGAFAGLLFGMLAYYITVMQKRPLSGKKKVPFNRTNPATPAWQN